MNGGSCIYIQGGSLASEDSTPKCSTVLAHNYAISLNSQGSVRPSGVCNAIAQDEDLYN